MVNSRRRSKYSEFGLAENIREVKACQFHLRLMMETQTKAIAELREKFHKKLNDEGPPDLSGYMHSIFWSAENDLSSRYTARFIKNRRNT